MLSQVKLIAEPWDIGAYDLGQFPAGWSEWNGKYRDTVRDFWRSTAGTLPDFATRVSGSRDLYGHGGRRPTASVNILTVHDGFTLADLVSYDTKHNEANGEDNRDGTDDNRSWNCGVEGPTDDPAVLELRARQRRNFIATLLLSEGVPLLLGGDEFARSQGGNNNAYCQDNELTWFDWNAAAQHADLVEFTARLCRLREQHPVFRRRQFFSGTPAHRERPRRPRLVPPRRRPDDRRKTGVRPTRGPSRWRSAALPATTPIPTIRSWCCSTPGGSRWTSAVPDSLRDLGWQIEVDTADPAAAGRAVDPSAAVHADRTLADAAARHTARELTQRDPPALAARRRLSSQPSPNSARWLARVTSCHPMRSAGICLSAERLGHPGPVRDEPLHWCLGDVAEQIVGFDEVIAAVRGLRGHCFDCLANRVVDVVFAELRDQTLRLQDLTGHQNGRGPRPRRR